MKLLLFSIALVILISACQSIQEGSKASELSILTPEKVVRLYYESFDKKDYETMYALISDGFKKIEPTAKDLSNFASYMGEFFKQGTWFEVKEVKETSNDGTKATVDYTIVMHLNEGSKIFRSTFTLKKKANGWKLIHPYGEKIDTS